jgi:carbon storage regulator
VSLLNSEGGTMLVLGRKIGEKVYIGENVCVTVLDIDRGKIRLGIEAPRGVPVYRSEIAADHLRQHNNAGRPVPESQHVTRARRRCPKCAAVVLVAPARHGTMSLDPEPCPEGNVVLNADGSVCRVVTEAEKAQATGPYYRSHWRTCPALAEPAGAGGHA